MIGLYLALLLLYIIFFLLTIRYRKNLRDTMRKDKLSLFRGMAMFIVDILPKGFWGRKTRTEEILKKIHIKEKVNKDMYLYQVERISTCLMTILIFLIIGVLICISEHMGNTNYIDKLVREEGGGKYEFFVDDGKDVEKVVIELEEKQLTKDESLKLLEKNRDVLVEQALGENESADKITKPMNLCNEIEGTDITVTWDISDSSVMDYEGKILSGISKEGVIINITANMMLNDVALCYTFPVNVFPRDYQGNMQEAIQEYVDSQSEEEQRVELPKKICDKSISYYKENSKVGNYILPIGIVIAFLMILLKDDELKKKEKMRDEELQLDYPEIVSKILLYSNAGLSIKNTVERIVKQYENDDKKNIRYAYEELKIALVKMKSGMSEINAINEYGTRCGMHCYIKFANIIQQNLRRGTRELSYALENEVNQSLVEKRNIALKKGSEISTKLLGPMIIMLVVALVIIMIPALMTINI